MIFELAAIVGVEPWRFSYRELTRMATERLKTEWDRTAIVAALLYNANKRKEDAALTPDKINPFRAAKSVRVPLSHDVVDNVFPTQK